MTSYRRIEANRRNALKSTGPRTEAGKHISRCNAVRHGLTAETVISALEDAEDYKAFEVATAADYNAQSAVRELVLRLASLLWRLRRATTIETGLFEIQADHLKDFRKARQISPASHEIVYGLFNASSDRQPALHGLANETETSPASAQGQATPDIELAHCFLRLCNLPNYALDRLSRYEAILWRQAGQILYALDALCQRFGQTFICGGAHEVCLEPAIPEHAEGEISNVLHPDFFQNVRWRHGGGNFCEELVVKLLILPIK
jgi:hypothetical protein